MKNRRTLLKFSLVGTAALTLLPVGAWFTFGKDSKGFIESVVLKHLGEKVIIDKPGLQKFSTYLAGKYQNRSDAKWKLLCSMRLIYRNTNILSNTPMKGFIWWIEKEIIHEYLMGTQFFYEMDAYTNKTKKLEYLFEYNPRLQACRNPFAYRG